jgi:hypothetical protein
METVKSFHNHLGNLQSQANKLTETGLALNTLFAGEETRLNREDEASSLRTVHRTIVEQLERQKYSERFASYGDSKTNLAFSLTGLAAKAIVALTTKSQQARDIVNDVFDTEAHKKPFGTVLVCVGPKGLPDDVRVASISELARESNRPQTEIMSKLQDDGYLLFSEEAFSLLIERLIGTVRGGKLHLPVSRDRLMEITGLGKPKSSIKVIEVD